MARSRRVFASQCRHCGSAGDLIPLSDGRPSSVCYPCRRQQVNDRRNGEAGDRTNTQVVRRSASCRMSDAERRAAFDRARARAASGMTMVDALKAEGVI